MSLAFFIGLQSKWAMHGEIAERIADWMRRIVIGGWCPFRLSPLQNEPGTVAAAARSQHACRRELVLYPGSSSV